MSLFDDNVQLAYWIGHKYFHDIDEDGEQCALIGLWKACENYDPSKGKLSAYATPYIIKAVSRHYKKENKHRNLSTDAEIAEDFTLLDTMASNDDTERTVAVADLLNRLKPREKEIALMKGGGLSNREIAKAYGISAQRVNQIIRTIRQKMGE